jgi:hypothetical protein
MPLEAPVTKASGFAIFTPVPKDVGHGQYRCGMLRKQRQLAID